MTTASYMYAGSDLPPKIQRAITRLMDPALQVELSAPERVAMAALLRRVEAKDGRAQFWVRRCNLAELFGKVERTVTNWLNALEDQGLISKEQGRTRWGNFSCVTVHLTDLAVKLFGLDQQLSTPEQQNRKKIAAGHKGCFTEGEQPYQGHLPPARTFVKTVDNSVPADCAPLLDLGVTAAGIFKLMKIARTQSKRLGIVIEARLEAIKQSRTPFAYVTKLLRDNVDYEAQRNAIREANRLQEEAEEAKRAAKTVRHMLTNKWIRGKAANRFVYVRGADELPEVYERDEEGNKNYLFCIHGQTLISFWSDMLQRYQQGSLTPATNFDDLVAIEKQHG